MSVDWQLIAAAYGSWPSAHPTCDASPHPESAGGALIDRTSRIIALARRSVKRLQNDQDDRRVNFGEVRRIRRHDAMSVLDRVQNYMDVDDIRLS